VLAEPVTGRAVARLVQMGAGTALVLGCDYPVHLETWRRFLALLGVRPRITHDAVGPGLVVTSVRGAEGDRVVFALNVAPHPVEASVRIDGEPVCERLTLPARGHTVVGPDGRRA
jgi:beta-galactosidase